MRQRIFLPLLIFLACPSASFAQKVPAKRGPVIDMHLHAMTADEFGPPPVAMCTPFIPPTWDQRLPYPAVFGDLVTHPRCTDPVWSPKTDATLMRETISAMRESHVVLGVLSGTPELVAKWRAAAPKGTFLSGIGLRPSRGYTVDQLSELRRSGNLDALAEVTNEYEGVSPNDPQLEPFFAFAEKEDIPVGIHIGPGPYGDVYLSSPNMRVRLNSALTLEDVLVKHPKMRIWIAHAGYPMIDDLLAVLYMYPQVYVDTGAIIFTAPREEFWRYLQRISQAGFGKRILFGSDQMIWPGTIERSIEVIEQDPYLNAEEKRDILYNNAARFLRLNESESKR
jgi:predicted TIM-barrel fold metal-dependent hydrolase